MCLSKVRLQHLSVPYTDIHFPRVFPLIVLEFLRISGIYSHIRLRGKQNDNYLCKLQDKNDLSLYRPCHQDPVLGQSITSLDSVLGYHSDQRFSFLFSTNAPSNDEFPPYAPHILVDLDRHLANWLTLTVTVDTIGTTQGPEFAREVIPGILIYAPPWHASSFEGRYPIKIFRQSVDLMVFSLQSESGAKGKVRLLCFHVISGYIVRFCSEDARELMKTSVI